MKRVMLYVILTAVLCFSANIKTIEGEYLYAHSDNESKIDARNMAVGLAKRDAVEKFATMITSTTVVENYEMKKDRVVANSCAMLRKIVYLTDTYDGAKAEYYIKISAEIDEDEVLKLLKETAFTSDLTNKISDLVTSGMSAEKSNRIGDALKNYYWAYLLIKCDEYSKEMKVEDFDKRLLTIAIPERMNKLFSGIEYKVKSIKENDGSKCVVLCITYNGQPVSNLDLTYYTGDSWSNIKSRNGLAQIDFFGHSAESVSRLMIKTEYKYENLLKFDEDVTRAAEKITHIPFPNAGYPPLALIVEETKPVAAEVEQDEPIEKINIEKDIYIESVSSVLEAIKSAKYHEAKHIFTDNGYQAFTDLIMYGNAVLLLDKAELTTYKLNDQTVVRSVPMSFSFPRNDTKFSENVVFTFNSENQIDAVTFALSDIAAQDIISKPDSFGTIEEKIQLVQFMELYKTAYCLKQADYIESIFADNALIIVGRVLKPGEKIDGMYDELSKGRKVKYDKMGKKEYINRLKKAFNSNEFININFEENSIEKKNKQKIYALEIKQYYNSTKLQRRRIPIFAHGPAQHQRT